MSKNHSVFILLRYWGNSCKALKSSGRLHLLRSNHLVSNSVGYSTTSLQNQCSFLNDSSCAMNEADPLYSSVIVNCVFNAFSAYTAIMLNILSIHAIRKTSSLTKPLKALLLSLAVSDFGVGLLAQPLFIAEMVNSTNSTAGIAFNIIAILLSNASFFNVVAISVDRFLAIHLHLRYQELVTHKRVVTAVILIWVLCFSFPLILIVSSKKIVSIVCLAILGFCFMITAMVNCKIYYTVQHHRNQIQVQRVQVAQNVQITESAGRQRKSALSTFHVFLVFLVCHLPEYCVLIAREIFMPSTALTQGLQAYSVTLVFLDSSLNPIIYCWKMKHIRLAMVDVLRNIFSRQN